MKKISFLIISSLFLLTGCGGSDETTSTIPPTPPQNPAQTLDNQKKNDIPNINTSVSISSNLIPATNPQDRLQQINQGRNDPFNTITPPQIIRIKADEVITQSFNTNKAIIKEPPIIKNETAEKSFQRDTNNLSARQDKYNVQGNINETSRNSKNFNNTLPSMNNIPPLSPMTPPQPIAAEQIIVSGILDLQGETVALVQTPWDNITRSVRIGDVLSDGNSGVSVRVKDIRFSYPTTVALQENNQTVLRSLNNTNGVVILEQYGKNIIQKIGQNTTNNKLAKL